MSPGDPELEARLAQLVPAPAAPLTLPGHSRWAAWLVAAALLLAAAGWARFRRPEPVAPARAPSAGISAPPPAAPIPAALAPAPLEVLPSSFPSIAAMPEEPPCNVWLRLLGPGDRPLEGRLRLYRVRFGVPAAAPDAEETTGPEGTGAADLPAGEYLCVAEQDGCMLRQEIEVPEGANAWEVTLRFPGRAVVHGTVQGAYGPLTPDRAGEGKVWGQEDLRVEMVRLPSEGEEEAFASGVDGKGNYRISGLAAGDYMLLVRTKFHSEQIRLDADDQVLAKDIRLPTGRISGRVFEQATGRPVDDVQVVLEREGSSHRIMPAADGSYAFPDLPPGDYRMFANGGDWVTGRREIRLSHPSDQQTADFPMAPGASIDLAVSDLEGNPLEHLRCWSGDLAWGFTGIGSGLEPGTRDVVAGAPGYEIAVRSAVAFKAGEIAPVSFRLAPAVPAELCFVDPGGKPVPGVRVAVESEGRDVQALSALLYPDGGPFVQSDAQGVVRVTGLKEGRYPMKAQREGFDRAETEIALKPGQARILVTMTPAE